MDAVVVEQRHSRAADATEAASSQATATVAVGPGRFDLRMGARHHVVAVKAVAGSLRHADVALERVPFIRSAKNAAVAEPIREPTPASGLLR